MADRTVTYRLSADIGNFKAQMAQASASVKTAADRMTGATKEGAKFRQGLDTVGSAAGKVGLVAAAGLGAAVMTAANFDQAMSNVQAATMESAAGMEALREAAITAGAETAFSASEAAAGIENLAKAGVSTQDVLGGGLTGALDLAAAGQMEVADAAETAATAMTQFGLAGEDVPHIADLLAAAAGKAQGEVSDFAQALNQSGLVAAQMGLSIEETTGSLAAFASAGLLGSDAGTSLKTMLLRLANPSAQAAGAMKKFGINAYDASGNMVSMAELAGQLQVAFADQSQATRDAALATIFGSDAIRAANVLYNQGTQGITDWTSKVDDSGFAAETASIKLDNLKGDFEAFTGALETALIGTGEGSQGFFRGLVQGATDAVNAFNDLPPSAQNATTAFLGLTAVAGGSLWAGSKIVRGIADTREALDQLGPAGTKAATGLRAASKAATVAAGALAGLAIVDALQGGMKDYTVGVEGMTDALLDLGKVRVSATLPDELEGLADSIDRLANPNQAQAFQDKVSDALGGIGGGSELREARAQIEGLDSALSSMVREGHADIAARSLKNLGLSSGSMDDLIALMPQYEEALQGAKNESRLAGDAAKDGAEGIDEMGDAASSATPKVSGFKRAIQELSGLLDKRSAFRNYEQAIDEFAKGIKDTGRSFDITTRKGRENQARLDAIAASAGEVAAQLTGVKRTEFVSGAIKQLRDMARELDIPQSEIRKLIDKLRETGKQKPKPEVTLEGEAKVNAAIRGILREMQDLDGTTAEVTTEHRTLYTFESRGARPYDPTGTRGRATGGPVYGPGTATSDSIPARLSNGEYVIKAAAVKAYGRELFDGLNAMRFAEGGYVSPSRVAPMVTAGGGRVVERVVERMPDRVTLDAGNGETLTMFVRRQAGGEVASDRAYRETLDRMGVA